jgi:AcrR family transcriptional regulator
MIPTQPLPANDEDSAKRRQIVEGARKVFRELGFDAASMGEIAKAAGVSKGTLYVYFADKLALFGAIVACELRDQGITKLAIDPNEDVETTLKKFGQGYMEMLCRPTGGSTVRTMMAIAERMPELGRRYYEHVPASWLGRLSEYLKTRVENGTLVIGGAVHAVLPGQPVPAVYLPGDARTEQRTHRRSGGQRHPHVSRCLPPLIDRPYSPPGSKKFRIPVRTGLVSTSQIFPRRNSG